MGLDSTKITLFSSFIKKELGILYQDSNLYQLEKRLEEVAKVLLLANVEDLYERASKGFDPQLKQVLLDISTNNETSFFRDPGIYGAIDANILTPLLAATPKKMTFSIWSCASSFGQEPYSLAILANEFKKKNLLAPIIDIYATDISSHALARARAARYSQLEVQRGLSAVRLVKNFQKDGDDYWILNSEIKNTVKFGTQNLLDAFQKTGPFDLVLCRYVLIYQSDDKKREIIAKIGKVLAPKGLLVLGGAESLIGLSNEFDQVSCPGAVFYRKK